MVGAGIVLPAVLDALPAPPKVKRALKIVGEVATLLGGFALRWAIMEAGKASAKDPRAARDATRLKNVTPKEPAL